MEHTGERMIPEQSDGRTFWEHINRYKIAAKHVRNKVVLDIACGEGYGSHSLSKAGALSVIGVDVSEESCEHARAKYGIDARQGDARAIPLGDSSVDVIVSFETIEHVENPESFVSECSRVLKPGGKLIISTPEVNTYQTHGNNPFHCSEMDEEQFRLLIASRFRRVRWYSQSLVTAGWWSLRSLSAIHSPWKRLRGFWRISSLCRHHGGEVDERDRQDPVAAILRKGGLLSDMVDPYHIRRRSPWTGEQPTYLLAIARKPKA